MRSKRAGKLRFVVLLLFPLLLSCRADAGSGEKKAVNFFPENFESGDKRAYAAGDVALSTGLWRLKGCLIGNTAQDAKAENAALRLSGGGSATMLFDIYGEVKTVRFKYALFGKDKQTTLSLWYASDSSGRWQPVGTRLNVSNPGIAAASVPVHKKGALRFSIRNDGPQRANVDDFEVVMADGSTAAGRADHSKNTPTRDDNLALGNPSNAATDGAHANNYLLVRPQYALSYNNEKGKANWVSWHLSMAWRGTATRCDCFLPDGDLPHSFFHPASSDYSGSSLNRGHLCPSEDRTASADDNAATFLMTNITPQAHNLNQQAWQDLEQYARSLSARGNELYIVAGSYGRGGERKKGGITYSISGGRIEVPAHFWKIIVVLPVGGNDIARVSKDTRVIAVDMPNTHANVTGDWRDYRCSVKSIEEATGYRFLKKIPKEIAVSLVQKVDNGREP